MTQRMAIYMQDKIDLREELDLANYMEDRGFSEAWVGDNRLARDCIVAMSALIMGTASQQQVSIDDAAMIATSYPDFMEHMAALGADISEGAA